MTFVALRAIEKRAPARTSVVARSCSFARAARATRAAGFLSCWCRCPSFLCHLAPVPVLCWHGAVVSVRVGAVAPRPRLKPFTVVCLFLECHFVPAPVLYWHGAVERYGLVCGTSARFKSVVVARLPLRCHLVPAPVLCWHGAVVSLRVGTVAPRLRLKPFINVLPHLLKQGRLAARRGLSAEGRPRRREPLSSAEQLKTDVGTCIELSSEGGQAGCRVSPAMEPRKHNHN